VEGGELMGIAIRIKRERRIEYKRLRKLRKARDVASALSKNKTKPYRLSIVKRHYNSHIDVLFVGDLAHVIMTGMPLRLNRPKPPSRRVVAKK